MDGDRRPDLTVWRASEGTWYWRTSSNGYVGADSKQWGITGQGDVPSVGDFDGDGRTDLAVWRASTGTWYWLTSSTGYAYINAASEQWGNLGYGDQPYLPDIDGDGLADLTVWRASDGTWYWKTSSSGYASAYGVQWGNHSLGDVPVVQ